MDYPKASCIADLERLIRERAELNTLTIGPLAQWEHKWKEGTADIIYVRGQYRSKGWTQSVFNPRGSLIRWDCPDRGRKGLFGKGIRVIHNRGRLSSPDSKASLKSHTWFPPHA